jgi:hypothetical protein
VVRASDAGTPRGVSEPHRARHSGRGRSFGLGANLGELRIRRVGVRTPPLRALTDTKSPSGELPGKEPCIGADADTRGFFPGNSLMVGR